MSKKYLLGIDSGTSVVKAVLFDLNGNELYTAVENTPIESPEKGWSEFNLKKDWDSVVKATRKLLYNNKIDNREIMAIGVTAKGWGCCYLDKNNQPARKGILWNDGRSSSYIKKWRENGLLTNIFKISGNYYFTGDCAPITRWLIENEPNVAKSVKSVIFPGGWIVYNLTGNLKICQGDPVSLLDISSLEYSDELFKLTGISSMRDAFLPTSSSKKVAGEVSNEAALSTGLRAGTPVFLGESDVFSSTCGVGVTNPGGVCIILGTAHIITICTDIPIFSSEIGLQIPYIDGKYLKMVSPWVATPNQDWFLDNFGFNLYEKARENKVNIYNYLEKELSKIHSGADGIIYHPYLSPVGERCPFTKFSAKANFFGLSLEHTSLHLLRAIFEGVAFSSRDSILASKIKVKDVMVAGGGSRSIVWDSIIANVLGKKVRIINGKEYGAKGAVINAMVGLGLYPNYQSAIDKVIKYKKIIEPNHKEHKIYNKYFELYKKIISHLWNDWEERIKILSEIN